MQSSNKGVLYNIADAQRCGPGFVARKKQGKDGYVVLDIEFGMTRVCLVSLGLFELHWLLARETQFCGGWSDVTRTRLLACFSDVCFSRFPLFTAAIPTPS